MTQLWITPALPPYDEHEVRAYHEKPGPFAYGEREGDYVLLPKKLLLLLGLPVPTFLGYHKPGLIVEVTLTIEHKILEGVR